MIDSLQKTMSHENQWKQKLQETKAVSEQPLVKPAADRLSVVTSKMVEKKSQEA